MLHRFCGSDNKCHEMVGDDFQYHSVCINSPVNIQMDPPQIATEGFSSDSLSERSPEQHIKNVEKSRRANIIFFGIFQNGC